MLSSYGGGLLAGDAVQLRLSVQPAARLLLGTQANTRVYRSENGATAEQVVEGFVGQDALAVVLPDPVVVQAASRYRQKQHWHLQPGAVLLLADWLHSGRMDSGEQFAFTALESEIRVSNAGRLIVLDRFAFRPEQHIAASPAHFGPHQTTLSVYVVGTPTDARYQQLAAVLAAQQPYSRTELSPNIAERPAIIAHTEVRPGIQLLRAAGRNRAALQPIYEALYAALAAPELLGFHAGHRKY
ncbi:urease accessory protein UreD [Hymenobacter pini]|uniref:urease accessory protein UreD n=1 Tax=Hymenobacter pini TaxID=2880879 RepID=UPI00293D5552|nr:urease accessory protein UreD [Hymenobacter pini]